MNPVQRPEKEDRQRRNPDAFYGSCTAALWLQLVEAAFTCMKDAKKSVGNRASHEKAKSRLPAVRKEGF